MEQDKYVAIVTSWLIAAVLIAILASITAVTFYSVVDTDTIIPKCQEDEVLMGVGEFNDGCWDSYICENEGR